MTANEIKRVELAMAVIDAREALVKCESLYKEMFPNDLVTTTIDFNQIKQYVVQSAVALEREFKAIEAAEHCLDADEYARAVGLTASQMFRAEEEARRACPDCPTSENRRSLRPHECCKCDERCDCGRDSSDCDWCSTCAPPAEEAGISIGPWNAEVGK